MITIVFAQTPEPIGGGFRGLGPFGLENLPMDIGAGDIMPVFVRIISNIIGIMTIIAGIWFIFQFIIGGLGFMTAGGDPKKMSETTKKITSALIGLVVVVAAYAIIHLLGAILGFDILNPQDIIETLGPGGVG
ncbi:MAG TPA: hypothetical protein VMX76_02645 [Nevskiaceae bacterium]|nr:hypothetical protein [Nevskiaceae bacterium]